MSSNPRKPARRKVVGPYVVGNHRVLLDSGAAADVLATAQSQPTVTEIKLSKIMPARGEPRTRCQVQLRPGYVRLYVFAYSSVKGWLRQIVTIFTRSPEQTYNALQQCIT